MVLYIHPNELVNGYTIEQQCHNRRTREAYGLSRSQFKESSRLRINLSYDQTCIRPSQYSFPFSIVALSIQESSTI